jgi:hypothetical protein
MAKLNRTKTEEHVCNIDETADSDLCSSCYEHAGFCDICGESNCCGSKPVDMDPDFDMER